MTSPLWFETDILISRTDQQRRYLSKTLKLLFMTMAHPLVVQAASQHLTYLQYHLSLAKQVEVDRFFLVSSPDIRVSRQGPIS